MMKISVNISLPLANITDLNSNLTSTSTTAFPSTVTLNNVVNTTTTSSSSSSPHPPPSVSTSRIDFNLTTTLESTTEASISVTEAVHKFQRKIWTSDGYGGYIPYDEQYTTPTSILLLNFFLVIFLMIVIGIAVYPAVKKYCDSTFFMGGSGNNRYWIEDNEEVVSVLTSNIPECSFALLNRNKSNAERTTEVSSSASASSMEPLIDVRAELA